MVTKPYQANIVFYYDAKDDNEAIAFADAIAGYAEDGAKQGAMAKLEAKVMEVELEPFEGR